MIGDLSSLNSVAGRSGWSELVSLSDELLREDGFGWQISLGD
jgi:hypothetical protein